MNHTHNDHRAYLDKNEKMCYTYDVLNRVTVRIVKNVTDDTVISTETFTYDAEGNITGGSVIRPLFMIQTTGL